jgi:hypothetical protein
MESLQKHLFKRGLVSVVVVSLTVCSSSVISVAAPSSAEVKEKTDVILEDQKKEQVDTSVRGNNRNIPAEEPVFVVTDPSVTVDTGEGIDGMTFLYIGGAVGLLAVGAMALGSGGSSSGSEPTPLPPTTPVVGPNLNGANWGGYLEIKNTQAQGFQNITATIVQNGSAVQITTSSTLMYGRMFNGNIKPNGFMKMYDSVTGEDWTTHYRNATATNVDLYDYVNGLRDLDRMLLVR